MLPGVFYDLFESCHNVLRQRDSYSDPQYRTARYCKNGTGMYRPEFENLKEHTSYQEHLASFSRKSRCKSAKEQRSQVTLTCGLVIFSLLARRCQFVQVLDVTDSASSFAYGSNHAGDPFASD